MSRDRQARSGEMLRLDALRLGGMRSGEMLRLGDALRLGGMRSGDTLRLRPRRIRS